MAQFSDLLGFTAQNSAVTVTLAVCNHYDISRHLIIIQPANSLDITERETQLLIAAQYRSKFNVMENKIDFICAVYNNSITCTGVMLVYYLAKHFVFDVGERITRSRRALPPVSHVEDLVLEIPQTSRTVTEIYRCGHSRSK